MYEWLKDNDWLIEWGEKFRPATIGVKCIKGQLGHWPLSPLTLLEFYSET